jgi:hypothetical protein
MPLLKRSNSKRHQGTFAQPLAKEERCVRPARLVRHPNHLKSTTPHKSASLDSSTSSTCSTKPPRKSCLTVRTLAQSLRYADQVKSNMSLCHAVVRGKPKSVTWSQTIQVQNYTTILGDHPCTSHGPPLSLGQPVGPLVNESMAPLGTAPTTSALDLLIPADVRERILIKAGYSRSELQNMEFKLLRIKLARHANAKQNMWEVLAKTTTKVSKRLTYSPMAYRAFKNSDDCERLSGVAVR